MIIENRPLLATSVFHNSAIDRLTPVVQGVALHSINYVTSTIAELQEFVLYMNDPKPPAGTGKPLIG